MIIRNFIIFIITLSQISWAQTVPSNLSEFIASYPQITEPEKDALFGELINELESQKQSYKYFYEGPVDSGEDSDAIRQWREEKKLLALPAQALAQKILEMPSEEINLFQLEMMKRYLEEPESRPAIKEMIAAFESLKFNPAYYDAIENQKDTLPHVGTGAVLGFGGVMLYCIFRKGHCAELIKKGQIAKEALERSRSTTDNGARQGRRRFSLRKNSDPQKSEAEKTWGEILDDMDAQRGLLPAKKLISAGSKASKMSYFLRYAKLSNAEMWARLKLVGTGMAAGALTWTSWQKLKNAYKDGKWEYTELDPAKLEIKYFGALAIVEMACQAKQITLSENTTYAEVRDYALSMQNELLMLGRMAGSLDFYDKTPLEFVTPLPETNEILISLPLADDMPESIRSFKRPCPGIGSQGEVVHAGLSEIELIFSELLIKGVELMEASE